MERPRQLANSAMSPHLRVRTSIPRYLWFPLLEADQLGLVVLDGTASDALDRRFAHLVQLARGGAEGFIDSHAPH